MSSQETLIQTPSQDSSVGMGPQTGSSNKQALKVVGVTLLAGILIAGQAFTAYMAYSQKEQLSTMERRSDRLQEISRKSAMRAPLKMHLPMSSLALTYEDEDSTSTTPKKPEPRALTQCQKEAAGEVKSLLPSFRPSCDEDGNYLSKQCWDKTEFCWCVDKNGVEIPDTLTENAELDCSASTFAVAKEMEMEPLGKDGH